MIIIVLFIIGFLLGLGYAFIGEKLPLLVPEVIPKEENSWIFNLFIGVVNALVFLVSYYYFGLSYEFFASLIIAGLVLIIFISDFKYMIILDSPLIVSGVLILILRAYFNGFKDAGLHLLWGTILFLVMLLIGFIGKKIFKKEALGGGDIKLAGIIGLILGLKLGLVSIILSSLLALPYAIASVLLNKDSEVPFGPFLIASMAIVFSFADKFLNLIAFLT